jgi:hypothetical protein
MRAPPYVYRLTTAVKQYMEMSSILSPVIIPSLDGCGLWPNTAKNGSHPTGSGCCTQHCWKQYNWTRIQRKDFLLPLLMFPLWSILFLEGAWIRPQGIVLRRRRPLKDKPKPMPSPYHPPTAYQWFISQNKQFHFAFHIAAIATWTHGNGNTCEWNLRIVCCLSLASNLFALKVCYML